jgi:hypothetical protein
LSSDELIKKTLETDDSVAEEGGHAIEGQRRGVEVFYNEDKFMESVTFNKWTRMLCHDISLLESYDVLYGRPCTLPGSANGAPFFFRNHPINYVLLCARVVDIENKTGSFWFLSVDDGSGSELRVRANLYIKDPIELLMGKLVEVRGLIRHDQYGRSVDARDIHLRDDRGHVPIQREFELYMEAINVRRHILSKVWKLHEENRAYLLMPAYEKPTQYCSLNREPSSVYSHSMFHSSIEDPIPENEVTIP